MRILFLVADKKIVRLFRRNCHGLEPFGEIKPSRIVDAGKFANHSVGRMVSSCSGFIHHKLSPRTEKPVKETRAFAHEISEWLDDATRDNSYDRLILVAPPKILGELRKILSDPVQSRIVAEVNKDLTKLDVKELQEELRKIVWF